MTDPVLLVIDADPQEVATFGHALRKRYGADYRVMAESTPEAGLEILERLAYRGDDVALVAADLRLPGTDGVEFLERARALHRGVVRALLVAMDEHHTRIPFSELETLQRATALGRIDFWVVKGWVTPEEWLYPQVQEALSAWTGGQSCPSRGLPHSGRAMGTSQPRTARYVDPQQRPVRVLPRGLGERPPVAIRPGLMLSSNQKPRDYE